MELNSERREQATCLLPADREALCRGAHGPGAVLAQPKEPSIPPRPPAAPRSTTLCLPHHPGALLRAPVPSWHPGHCAGHGVPENHGKQQPRPETGQLWRAPITQERPASRTVPREGRQGSFSSGLASLGVRGQGGLTPEIPGPASSEVLVHRAVLRAQLVYSLEAEMVTWPFWAPHALANS